MSIQYRPARQEDAAAIISLCATTIRNINRKDYCEDQILLWTERIQRKERMEYRLQDQHAVVATESNTLVGVITWSLDGYIDLLYVSKDHQRQGIATYLLTQSVQDLQMRKIDSITSDVSVTARPFFEKAGFKVVQQQEVDLGRLSLTNFKMILRPEEVNV